MDNTDSLEEISLVLEDLDHSEQLDLDSDIDFYRAEHPNGEVVRAALGQSTHFRPVARSFGRLRESQIDMLLYDMKETARNVDLAVFLPDDVAKEFEDESRGYGPAMFYTDGQLNDLTAKTRTQSEFKNILGSWRFEELYDYVEREVFDRDRMLAVNSQDSDYPSWKLAESCLISDTHSIMASPDDEALKQNTSNTGISDVRVREKYIEEGLKQVEIYNKGTEEIEVVPGENGASLVVNDEVVETYEEFTLEDVDVLGRDQHLFYLVKDQQ